MKKKNIYIAYTGGTIGMKKSKNGYVPISGHLQKQIAEMPEFYSSEMPIFTIKEYQPIIDSSNITPKEWKIIGNDIKKKYYKYDGFIILHGTDTMAYTASALSFILENLQKPIIITGSQIPLSEIRSDGRQNLINALFLVTNYPINEVTLLFNNKLYRGNRTTKKNTNGFDAFDSPNLAPLLEIGISINYSKKLLLKNKINKNTIKINKINSQPIGLLRIYPGISFNIIKYFLLQPVKAIVLCSYGSGNVPQKEEFFTGLKQALEKDIVVINLTQCMHGKVNMNKYATGSYLSEIGVISGYDLTIEAALAKLYFLLSQNLSNKIIKKKMQKNLRGELTKK
ncbi:MAG TPA: asparaginase [Buchnera sp. (in: enterobacteria)]|nr:asparaginase [Buchnera sp. (in: enterobacteria)]